MTTPKAPSGLTPATRRWWQSVVTTWQLEAHHIRLLTLAAKAWDEAEGAAWMIRREGLLIEMPSGARRPHPAVRIANEARAVYMRAIRELDLDVSVPAEAKRPPALLSIRGGRKGA